MKKVTVPQRAKQVAEIIKIDQPDYYYLKELFRGLRKELSITRQTEPKKLPYIPSSEEIMKYYDVVWHNQNKKHMVIVRLLLYTGIKIGELVKLKIEDVKLRECSISIKGDGTTKERLLPFYYNFKKALSEYITERKSSGGEYLFESNWKKPFSTQGIRSILAEYSKLASMKENITPNKLRHFLFLWMKEQNLDDDLIQYYSGNDSKEALKIYDKIKILHTKNNAHHKVMQEFPI
jgi:integrase/recombinase XerD